MTEGPKPVPWHNAHRMPPHPLEEERTPHPGALGYLDALVDAVERHNLGAGPDAPAPPRLVRLAVRVGAQVKGRPRARLHATPGGALHDALMEVTERYMPQHTEAIPDD
jgi:hypothetical protein